MLIRSEKAEEESKKYAEDYIKEEQCPSKKCSFIMNTRI